MKSYDLRLGLPHTNYNALAEHLLMMHAGHFQWTAIAETIGVPLSALRTVDDREVYSTFYFIETRLPKGISLNSFKLDDDLKFLLKLRSFKNIAVEGQVIFNHAKRIDMKKAEAGVVFAPEFIEEQPFIRFGNVFITPDKGNSKLKVASPANGDFKNFAVLPNAENPYNVTRNVETKGAFGLFDGPDWMPLNAAGPFVFEYEINPDRDSNGAGLVYFCNYFAFMDMADRRAMQANERRRFSPQEIHTRSTVHRLTGYFGNAQLDEKIQVEVSLFEDRNQLGRIGCRYLVRRSNDRNTICISEAIKTSTP